MPEKAHEELSEPTTDEVPKPTMTENNDELLVHLQDPHM
jgi:hypothetical protein